MNIVISAKGLEMESFIFCKVNIFGLARYVKKLMRGGMKDDRNYMS